MNIPVVFEDDWFLVVDKPAGLLSVPAPGKTRTLTGILNEDARDRNLTYLLYPCHRLDRQTSGLLIFAKSKEVEEKFDIAFRERKIGKKYVAFVQGKLSAKRGQINFPIDGKEALTKYAVLEERNTYSMVEVMPLTGRTNQIRIHFKRLGHPLVGEDKFAFRKDFALKFKRVCLHAQYLEFMHPVTGRQMAFKAPLPSDMQKFLREH